MIEELTEGEDQLLFEQQKWPLLILWKEGLQTSRRTAAKSEVPLPLSSLMAEVRLVVLGSFDISAQSSIMNQPRPNHVQSTTWLSLDSGRSHDISKDRYTIFLVAVQRLGSVLAGANLR